MALTDPQDYKRRKGAPPSDSYRQSAVGGLTSPEDYKKRTMATENEIKEPVKIESQSSRSIREFLDNINPSKTLIGSNNESDIKNPEPAPFITKAKQKQEDLQRMGMQSTLNVMADQRQEEEARQANLTPYERWYENHITKSPIGKVLGGLQKADTAVSNFKSGALDTATFGASQGLGREALKSIPEGDENLLPVMQDRKESSGYKAGEIAGYLPPGALADRIVVKVGGKLLEKLPAVANGLVRGGAAGALDMANQEAGDVAFREGEFNPENVALGAGLGGVLGAAIPAIGAGVKSFKQRGLRKEIGDFVDRMNAPRSEPTHPSGAIVQEAPSSNITSRADAAAGNFKRWENIQRQYDDAVENQYQLLKKQMDERGGVTQGNVITDPTTGEVVDRFGRTSNNPKWYQDFFEQNGRKPNQKELRKLAEEQVKKGYADDTGNIPPWKPVDIEDIDGELASIRGMMDSSTNPTEKAALQQVATTLETSRSQIRQQLPEGVQGRVSGSASSAPAVKEPTDINELVHSRGYADVTPETIAQTYNTKKWYHGTGTDQLTAERLDPFVGSHESLFGQGVYLTDEPTIAQGYAKSRGKRGTPTVYESDVNVDRVLDIEKPITKDVAEAVLKAAKGLEFHDDGYIEGILREQISEGTTTEQVITKLREEVRDLSHELMIPTSEFVETFQDLAINLKQAGYDGITHTGGLRTGKDPHRVLILLDPQNHHGTVEGPRQVTRLEKYVSNELPEGVKGRVNTDAKARSNQPAVPNVSTQAASSVSTPPVSGSGKKIKTITRTQLVNNIKRYLGITIDTGRTGGGKGVLGVYKIQPEVIRTAAAQDHDTIAHEIGHHFVKKYRIDDPQFERELTNMMDTIGTHPYRQYPRNEWLDEGVAEYMRVYLADPQKAKRLAPRYSAFLDQKLPKNVQKGLRNVQKDVKIWLDQGEYNQAKGMLDHAGGTTQGQVASRSKLYTRFFDDLHPIELLEKSLKGAVGIGSRSMYKLARLSRGVGEQAKMAAIRGIFDSKGNKLAEGIKKIVSPLEKIGMKQEDFATYLTAIHANDLKALGKEVPFTDAHMAAVVQKWGGNQAVQKAQKEIVKYNNALMDLMVEAQIFDRKTVDALRKKYPNYVPFMRYFDDDAVAGFKNGGYGSSSGFANLMNPVKRMSEEGSSRTIINPLESMVKNTFLVMNAVAKNKVGLQLADLSRVEGAGAWVEHVPGGKSGKEHIVDVWQNGKKQSYKIRDPELYNAMLSLDHESANSLIKFLGGAAGILRAGATLTPDFMVRNAFRDVAGAIINSTKYGFNPLDFFKGFFHTVTKSDVFEKFVNSGGAMSTMMSLDRDASREATEAVFKLSMKDKAMNVVTSPAELAKYLSGYKAVKGTVGLLRKGAEISELSTKVGTFNKVLNKTGDIEEAAYSARDLMDFNRAGSSIRQANRAVAFLNSALQGVDKTARSFWGDSIKDARTKASFMTRAFTTLVLPATMIYYWNRNLPDDMKEKYDNIPQWQKNSFFVIGIPGLNEFIRIPKPFEAGMLFATSTERMLKWLQGNEPDAFDGYGKAVISSLTPPMMFTALSPLLEALTNHSFFRNAPVVPQGELQREKKDQYGVYTSELAKGIGGFIGKTKGKRIDLSNTALASPRIIDNTIKGYTAGLGQYGVDLIDKGIELVRGPNPVEQPAKKWTEDPFFRSFFVTTAGGGQVREDFYNKWNKIESAKASADFNEEQLPVEKMKEYARMKPYKNEIDKLYRAYKEIQRSKQLSAKEKRSQLDELDVIMNEAARDAIGK